MKAPLILIISERMDSNRKAGRNEDGLIRIGQKARTNLNLSNEKTVEVWPNTDVKDRISRSKTLEIFTAYSSDIKRIKEELPEEDFLRVGFVTTKTFEWICKDKNKEVADIWLADTVEDTVIGSDPEFILEEEKGRYRYANTVAGFGGLNAKFGSDGPLPELRPDPLINVDDFVQSMKDLFQKHPSGKAIQKFRWLSGCYFRGPQDLNGGTRGWEVGGHIHFGNPARLSRAIESYGASYKNAVFSCLTKILDEYVAIPLMRLDKKEESIRRRMQYGKFGDVRLDHGRLEYRVLSGEWFSHPKLAVAVLGTAKAIAHSFFKILDEADLKHSMVMLQSQENKNRLFKEEFFDPNFSYWKNIAIIKEFKANKTSREMQTILNDYEITFNAQFFNRIKRLLRGLPTYKEYSKYVDSFLEIVSLPSKELAKIDKDLKRTWVEEKEFII